MNHEMLAGTNRVIWDSKDDQVRAVPKLFISYE
jgi:hypothetical protein